MEAFAVVVAAASVVGTMVGALAWVAAAMCAALALAAYLEGRAGSGNRYSIGNAFSAGAVSVMLVLAWGALSQGSTMTRESSGWQLLIAGDTSGFLASWSAQVDLASGLLMILVGLLLTVFIGKVLGLGRSRRASRPIGSKERRNDPVTMPA